MFGSMMSFVARTATAALVFLPVVEAAGKMIFTRDYGNCGPDSPVPHIQMSPEIAQNPVLARIVNELADRTADMLVIFGAHIADVLLQATCEVVDELYMYCKAEPSDATPQPLTASETGMRVSVVGDYQDENHCHAGGRLPVSDAAAKSVRHKAFENKGSVFRTECLSDGSELECQTEYDESKPGQIAFHHAPGTLEAVIKLGCSAKHGPCETYVLYTAAEGRRSEEVAIAPT